MDLSALIFVALAVAWAVYLIPKALRHHEEDAARRSVDSFSDRMRVLARREAVTASKAELVVGSQKSKTSTEVVETQAAVEVEIAQAHAAPAPLTPLQARLRRAAAARAARRRRRVLGTLVVSTLVVVGLAAAAVIPWVYVAIPAAVIVAWLVACRLMVRKEQAARVVAPVRVKKRRRTLADVVIAEEDAVDDATAEAEGDETSEVAAVDAQPDPTPGGWDPVPMTLPTYVAKAAAGRTVRTIDLDSTGVWSSGRNAADSQLAREAQATAREAEGESERRRASGA
ncbi:hypothetical protein HNR19_000486 [Nocardioides thalensis]|uniref:Uncharacterized protein n=1 Tax=Nocardioides thalensis TaxID=1914755 RepID=A0A853BZI8_9ACTN|nr:hypothetical protein [Nocardioides thalensis]NYI99787.1 hypothetical protein [Nocardioides thalensis]